MVSQTVKPGFVAGRIKLFTQNWESITTDSYILNMVTGCKIDLQKIPVQHIAPRETNFSAKELHFVNDEIAKLLNKKVIDLMHNDVILWSRRLKSFENGYS